MKKLLIALLFAVLPASAYAQISISNQPPASLPVATSDLGVISQWIGGHWITKRVPLGSIVPPLSVTASMLASGAAATNIGLGGVTASMLASGAAASNLGAGAVGPSLLAAGAAASNIGSHGVTSGMLAVGVAASNLGITPLSGVSTQYLNGLGAWATIPSTASALPSGAINTGLVYAPTGSAGTAQTATDMVGFRNRLVNGDFRLWQRGAGGAGSVGCTTSCIYWADRWMTNATGAAVNVAYTAAPAAGFQSGLTITGAASNTSAYIAQRIEASNIYDQVSQTDTLQATLFCSGAQTIKWAAYYPTTIDNYATESLIASGTWSATITAATYSAQIALGVNAINGVEIRLYPQNGGAFASGSCTFTGIQLEPGNYATAFERLSYSIMYVLAQRYYQISGGYSGGWGATTTAFSASITLPVVMRATPTLTMVASPPNAIEITVAPRAISAAVSFSVGATGGEVDITTAAASGSYHPGLIPSGVFTLSAEL